MERSPLATCLARAREIVRGGWTEPLPRASDGTVVDARSEEAALYDVDSALQLGATSSAEYFAARELLEGLVAPATHALNAAAEGPTEGLNDFAIVAIASAAAAEVESLAAWLERPNRTREHVLRLFDAALLRIQEAA